MNKMDKYPKLKISLHYVIKDEQIKKSIGLRSFSFREERRKTIIVKLRIK